MRRWNHAHTLIGGIVVGLLLAGHVVTLVLLALVGGFLLGRFASAFRAAWAACITLLGSLAYRRSRRPGPPSRLVTAAERIAKALGYDEIPF